MSLPSKTFILAFTLSLFSLAPRAARAQEEATCPTDWKKNVYLSARDSVVSIESVGFSMEHLFPVSGFVYKTRSHVVAIAPAAGIGRGVRVRFAGGREIRAEPVAIDEERHVTILKLAEEAPAPPLRLSERPLEVGQQVVGVSPFEGVSTKDPDATELDAHLHVGHIANVGDRTLLRLDATEPATVGAPLFDCTGEVVGLRAWGAIVPAHDILPVTPSESPVDARDWSVLHFHMGLLGQLDQRPRLGMSIGWAAIYGDRLQFRLGVGVLAALPRPSERDRWDEKTTELRLQAEPMVGYRILVNERFPTYVVPQIGAAARLDFTTKSSTNLMVNDVGCIARGGPCSVEPVTRSSTHTSTSVAPAIGVGLIIPGTALTYQAQFDMGDPTRPTHQLFLGFEF